VIRRAAADDWEAWLAVHETVAAEGRWIGAEVPLDMESVRRHFDEHVADDGKAVFVAEVDGRVVGNLGIHVYRYGVAEFGMAVLDGFRGRGIGSALLEAGIQFARERGAHKVALQMWPHNEAGRRLYEKYGFVDEGLLRRHYPRRNGELWDAVIMGLLL
jgi:RimJ/RimL family protein N-acetyltransferase